MSLSPRQWNSATPLSWKIQRQWLSVSKEPDPWDSGRPGTTSGDAKVALDTTTPETLAAGVENDMSEKDLIMNEIQRSIQRNVARILDRRPLVKEHWESILRKQQWERENKHYSELKDAEPWDAPPAWGTTVGKNDAGGFLEVHNPWDTEPIDPLGSTSTSRSARYSPRATADSNDKFEENLAVTSNDDFHSDALATESMHKQWDATEHIVYDTTENYTRRLKEETLAATESDVGVGAMPTENVGTAWGASAWDNSAPEKTTSVQDKMQSDADEATEKLSLLEMLRQPIEDEAREMENHITHERIAPHDLESPPIQASSLLDLLNDDDPTEATAPFHYGQVGEEGRNDDVISLPSRNRPSESKSLMSDFPQSSLLDILRQPMEEEIQSARYSEEKIATEASGDSRESVSTRTAMMSTDFKGASERELPPLDFGPDPCSVMSMFGPPDDCVNDNYDGKRLSSDMHQNWINEAKLDRLGAYHESSAQSIEKAGVSWPTPITSMDDVWTDDSYQFGFTDAESQSPSNALDCGLALILAMKDTDWAQLNTAIEDDEDDSSQRRSDDVKDELLGPYGETEEIVEEIFDEEMNGKNGNGTDGGVRFSNDKDNDILLDGIRVLLQEASFGDIEFSTEDYNTVLLHLATSTSLHVDDAMGMMIKTYQQMSELAKAGEGNSAPDATTYTVLMVALDRRAQAPLTAADVCREMMDSNIEVSAQALVQGMRCFQRRNNVQDAERLLNYVLDDKEHQTVVPVDAFTRLLEMYKVLDLQQEAADLVAKCIKVRRAFFF